MLLSHNILKSNVVLIMPDGQNIRQPEADHATTLLLRTIERFGEVRVLESRKHPQTTHGFSFWRFIANDFEHFSQITHVVVDAQQADLPPTDYAPLHRS